MATCDDAIGDEPPALIRARRMRSVATAPAGGQGRIDRPPTGPDGVRRLGPMRMADPNPTGGHETSTHPRRDGRITVAGRACAGPPKKARRFRRGAVVPPEDAARSDRRPRFGSAPGPRRIVAEIASVGTSGDVGVPLSDEADRRATPGRWEEAKGEDSPGAVRAETGAGVQTAFRAEPNARGIHGLLTPFGNAPTAVSPVHGPAGGAR